MQTKSGLIDSFVEIRLPDDDASLKIKETLTRIGVASKRDNKLYQSCHILHKRGKFYIVAFKELFLLDDKPADFTDNDQARRNTIANLLAEWGLCTLVSPQKSAAPVALLSEIKVIPFSAKSQYVLVPKYNLGKYRKVI